MVKEEATGKPILTVQKFLYFSATDADFRKKYLNSPEQIEKDFYVTGADIELIRRLDFANLNKELDALNVLEVQKLGSGFAATHCKDSHVNHWKDDHNNDSHSNGCSDMFQDVMHDMLVGDMLKLKKEFRGGQ
jgi:hypothetical protein